MEIDQVRGQSPQRLAPTSREATPDVRVDLGGVSALGLWLPVIACLGYGSIFWWRPLWLLQLDDRLPSKGIPVPLAHHPHVLDAWVTRHRKAVWQWFESQTALAPSQTYIPIPVILNGTPLAELTPRDLQGIFGRSPGVVSIVGEGGTGKTALVVQIGRWATQIDSPPALSPHPMLPIGFDEALQGDRSPIETIGEQLQGATGASISPKLVSALLRRGRILVVSDGISAMEPVPQEGPEPPKSWQMTGARLVASRSPIIEKVSTARIELLPLGGYSLAHFLETYLQQHQKDGLFDGEEFFEICQHLCALVGDRPITPFSAIFYADWAIAHREKQSIERQPKNLPELILDYLDRLNSQGPSDRKWHDFPLDRYARVLAWECLKRTHRSTLIPEEDAIAALGECDRGNLERARTALEFLIRDLALLKRQRTTGKVGFICSSVAEYLAGSYLVERYQEDETAWRQFLDRVKNRSGNLNDIRDFLLALRECTIAGQPDAKVPQWVPEELGEIAGLDPIVLKKAQLKHRIRALISQLSLPDTRLRQLAADQLGEMGAQAVAAIPSLVETLDDEDERVRIHSAVALGKMGVEAVPALVNAFKKENKEVRSGAAFALERMGETAIPALVEALKLEDSDVLSGTVFALERMGDAAIPALVEALKKGDNNVRVLTSMVLGRIGSPAAIALVEAFQNGNATVRHHAANALGSMGAEASAAVPAFEAALLDRDKEVRSSAVFVLERIGAAAVPTLQGALTHQDWLVRRNAADALGRMGAQAKVTIPDLERARTDRDKYVREAAEEALQLIQGPARQS